MMTYQTIIDFWFNESKPEQWFAKNKAFDKTIQARFQKTLEQASKGELFHWRDTILGRLAEIIVLDQFSRNIYRDQAKAFAADPMALVLSQEALKSADFSKLSPQQTSFLLMPLMHSESKKIHAYAQELFQKYASQSSYDFELKHKRIIDRFGRYPHRNAILGRNSTKEELAFLQQAESSF